MNRPTLTQLNLKPLCPTVIGSSALPGWYAYFQDQVKAYPEQFGPVDLHEALEDARRLALEDQVKAGIELVTDGEMGRVDFNLGFYDYLTGIVSQPIPRRLGAPAHDQREKYTCVNRIDAPNGLGTVNEFCFLRSITDLPIKIPVPGPFTLAGRLDGGEVYHDRLSITEALIPIINKEIQALVAEGCRFIQLDEPSFACHPDNPEEFIHIINRTLEGIQNTYISLHMCFGNFRARAVAHRSYAPIFPALLKANIDQFALEFASRELSDIEMLEMIAGAGKSIAVGLVDVKNLWIEPVDLLVARIKVCLKYAPAEALHITADCGYSQTARYAAVGKMRAVGAAVAKVRAEIGIR